MTIQDIKVSAHWSSSQLLKLSSLAAASVILLALATIYLPQGIDWHKTYRPATLALLAGQSPFAEESYFAPPWTVIPLLPLAVLPEALGRALLLLVSLAAFAFTAIRMGASRLTFGAFLLSPPVMHCLLNANIEWLPLLGFVMPPWLGLLFVTMKPQTGGALVVFWLVEAWRTGGAREVVRVFWPLTLLTLLSFALLGFWPAHLLAYPSLIQTYSASLWPLSIPVGLALLVAALRKREIRFAIGASPCLSPVLLLHGWSGALVALTGKRAEILAAVLGLWLIVIF